MMAKENIRLAPSGINRNDDLPEKRPTGRELVTVGEGEHIGRPVTIQIAMIEVANSIVTGDQEVDFRSLPVQRRQTTRNYLPEFFSYWSGRSSLPPYLDSRHLPFSSG